MEIIHEVIIGFFIGKVIINGIIAHWFAKRLMELGKLYFSKTESKDVIWQHFQDRALGNGHQSRDILQCGQGKCATF